MKRVASLMTGLVLMIALAAFAQATADAKTKAKTGGSVHQATGVINSIEGNTLVLTHKVKGKDEQTSFTMNDQTAKQGDLKSGEKATVHYRVENNSNVATMVKASAPKSASHAKAAKPTKS